MISTITIIAKQHLIGIIYPLTYLTWIVQWRNPSRLTFMVYMGVEVTTCSGIYGDGVKAGVATGVPH
jgi:hypothetical protein